MHLSGQLSDWSINDLLQIMQVTKKTGSLDIEGERRGRIHFRDGTVTGAELTTANGGSVGQDRGSVADVLFVLSTLNAGDFAVGPADGPETPGWSVEDVLADVAQLRSLEGEVEQAGLIEAGGVRLLSDIGEPMSILPKDWAVIVSLIEPFTFGELEASLGRGSAVRVLHALHHLGVAEAIHKVEVREDESSWFDRLADDISPEPEEPTFPEEAAESGGEEPIADFESPPAEIPAPSKIEAEDVRGVSAPASTTLTDGVYDEIRRLRSKVAEK